VPFYRGRRVGRRPDGATVVGVVWHHYSSRFTLEGGGSDEGRESGRVGIHFREERGQTGRRQCSSIRVAVGGGLLTGGGRGREVGLAQPVGPAGRWARGARGRGDAGWASAGARAEFQKDKRKINLEIDF
jgi:hypothetical protein